MGYGKHDAIDVKWTNPCGTVVSCILYLFLVLPLTVVAQSDFDDELIVKELELRRIVKSLILDKAGFLWIGTDRGLYRFDGYDYDLVGGEALSHLQMPAINITQMITDSQGNIWASTRSEVYVINRQRSHVIYADKDSLDNTFEKEITSLIEVQDEIWLADLSSGITCFDLVTDKTKELVVKRKILIPGNSLRFLFNLPDGNVLISTPMNRYFIVSPGGDILADFVAQVDQPVFYPDLLTGTIYLYAASKLYQFDPYKNVLTPEVSFEDAIRRHSPTWFLSGTYANQAGFWLGNKKGNLLWYSPEKRHYYDITWLLSDRIYAGRFFSTQVGIHDGKDGIWIGTNQGLIHLQVPAKQNFSPLPVPASVYGQNFSTRGIYRGTDQSLFVAGYQGFYRYLPDGTIKEYTLWKEDDQKSVNPLVYDFLPMGDELWLATEGNGLLVFDPRSESFSRSVPVAAQDIAQGDHGNALWLFRIMKDHNGVVWLGTQRGLFIVDKNKQITRFRSPGNNPDLFKIFDIREDVNGVLWVGGIDGLFNISSDRNSIRKVAPNEIQSAATCVYPMNDGRVMIGTQAEGIKIHDPITGDLIGYSTEHGLANEAVASIQSTEQDVYWIATNTGLSRFNLAEQKFRNYYLEDGLPDNEFNHGSWMRDTDGALYFGGVGGIVRVNPQDEYLKETAEESSPILRVSKVNYHDGKTGTTRYLSLPPGQIPEIRLGFRDKYFTVYYSTSDCIPNSRQTYAYMLEGFHPDWQVNDTKNSVQFTGLQPGGYTLKIRLLGNRLQDDQNILQIPVFVERPFYKEWWAYLIYIFTLSAISFVIFREHFQRQHIRRKLQLESELRLKVEEINKSKSTFFTNITHEFKTPLTLIQGPAEEISRLSKDVRITRHANLIAKNARAMLALVNRLLELGKLEAKLDQPQFYRLDLVSHLRPWVGNFDSLAKQKHIQLTLQTGQPAIYADFDPVKLETVINNLLSNAIKFTPEFGHIECLVRIVKEEAAKDLVEIVIQDDGPGIDEAEQEFIFERFYQGKNSQLGGTGIGLAFVQEMIRAHHGSIKLDSTQGRGARFIISLPMFQENAALTEPVPLYEATTDTDNLNNVFKPLPSDEMSVLLIAEDNTDVAQLINDTFDKEFKVIITHNGRDAHQKALELIPDLIITDVMMPVMDGLSLTHQLKTDIHTSHIPVVMLTAKDGLASRIEGLTHGADVYINKPFSVNELKLTVRNLLFLRSQVQQKVSSQMAVDISGIQFANDQDSTFYHSFLAVLEKNISEPELSVQDFIRELGVSRTQLHRKLKAITGQSANQVVRSMRLQKGLSMLKHSGKTISEVAYDVGFSSPSYFTERFREFYGYPPSEVATHSQS